MESLFSYSYSLNLVVIYGEHVCKSGLIWVSMMAMCGGVSPKKHLLNNARRLSKYCEQSFYVFETGQL